MKARERIGANPNISRHFAGTTSRFGPIRICYLQPLPQIGWSCCNELRQDRRQSTGLERSDALACRLPENPYCLVPLSCFGDIPKYKSNNGSQGAVGHRVVGAPVIGSLTQNFGPKLDFGILGCAYCLLGTILGHLGQLWPIQGCRGRLGMISTSFLKRVIDQRRSVRTTKACLLLEACDNNAGMQNSSVGYRANCGSWHANSDLDAIHPQNTSVGHWEWCEMRTEHPLFFRDFTRDPRYSVGFRVDDCQPGPFLDGLLGLVVPYEVPDSRSWLRTCQATRMLR